MSTNKENEHTSGVGTSDQERGKADTTGGSSGTFGGGAGATGAMGGGQGFGGTTGSGLGGRQGTETADVVDTPDSERGGGTGGDITGSVKDTADQ